MSGHSAWFGGEIVVPPGFFAVGTGDVVNLIKCGRPRISVHTQAKKLSTECAPSCSLLVEAKNWPSISLHTQAEKLSTRVAPNCTLLHVCCTTAFSGSRSGRSASRKTPLELGFCERAADRDRTGMISLEG